MILLYFPLHKGTLVCYTIFKHLFLLIQLKGVHMSAFGIGTNSQRPNAVKIRGAQKDIACACWFTNQKKPIPYLIKFIDENGEIQTVREIKINCVEEKNYSGIPSLEYPCQIVVNEISHNVKLIFFMYECKWIMTFL